MTFAVQAPALLPFWQNVILLTPSAIALVTAVWVTQRSSPVPQGWRVARRATVAMLVSAIVAALLRLFGEDRANALLRSDPVGCVVLVLVGFVGWVCIRYSASYLDGDAEQRQYISLMMSTIGTVGLVVVTNNLVVLALAWTTTSLVLHGLLTFFGDRKAAVVAAHKKFILARISDVCMLGSIVLFFAAYDTLRIDEIVAFAAGSNQQSMSGRFGIGLIAVAAILKCAQLPFHGWLIQVMEAPTPVSALLHAGVVNLGGFVLLRFAPLVDQATETRVLLVVVGTITSVVASLVMTTRVSIKVSLAWSTCAQMGFMLLQCGLGAWEMALLHLVAHSLYKAHAFLGAGGTVRQTQRKQLAGQASRDGIGSLLIGTLLAFGVTIGVGVGWSLLPFAKELPATIWVLGGIVALALVPLKRNWVGAFAIPVAYFALHELFGRLVPTGAVAPAILLGCVGVAFSLLFVLQTAIAFAPEHGLPRRMYPWFFGGLFLDEKFTRIAFRIWKPPTTKPRVTHLPFSKAMVRQ